MLCDTRKLVQNTDSIEGGSSLCNLMDCSKDLDWDLNHIHVHRSQLIDRTRRCVSRACCSFSKLIRNCLINAIETDHITQQFQIFSRKMIILQQLLSQ